MNESGVAIIIPALNEIEGMKWFMPRIKKEWHSELIVVDGGSVDGTFQYCKDNGYPVFVQSGKGYANALDEAFRLTKNDIVITVTPDGNSLPEVIPQLVQKLLEGYDMVIASRYLGQAKSYDDDIFTSFGNILFTKIINLLFRAKYTDTLVGFRAYRRSAIEKMRLCGQDRQGGAARRKFIGMNIEMNSWDPGSSIRAAKLRLKVGEISGDEPKRIGGKRKLSIIKGGLGVLLQILYEFVSGCNFSKHDPGKNR